MQFTMKENSFKTEVEFGELQISGDEQHGFRPYQLLVSSIAVCSGGVLRKVLEKKRVSFSDISISADVTRNDQGAKEVQKIALHFVITGQGLTESKIEKALAVTRKNCSMVQSVKDSIEVTESFELIEE
ncbi:OsmC family protein [Desertibacillus haloalkaliphilus]|uniref:OsmC family protein n=1 Tax=Desertibacillus haloalkaliphilus TaxID=1328930 RepID=UPI001C276716|nr:OsmC family protein [Desertibacillus haloalkaliphilus]MBU8908900.1 OsmC family protein [Desertibacillus haloalkaliphilus]